jgi:hypothetical protein
LKECKTGSPSAQYTPLSALHGLTMARSGGNPAALTYLFSWGIIPQSKGNTYSIKEAYAIAAFWQPVVITAYFYLFSLWNGSC